MKKKKSLDQSDLTSFMLESNENFNNVKINQINLFKINLIQYR